MTDTHTAAKAIILAAIRGPTVANAAGVASLSWSERVLLGNKEGYIEGLHRGRLPAVEIFQISDTWNALSSDNTGTTTARWTIRVHSGIPSQDLAEEQCRAILYASLIKIREQQYFWIGDDVVQTFTSTPLGHALECNLDVQTSMTRETYETIASGSTGTLPDGGTVGGISKTINFGDTSPIGVLALPTGQAVALVQIKVITAFDGAAPTLTVGIEGDTARYMTSDQNELGVIDSVWEVDVDDPGPKTINVYLDSDGSTQGQVKIQILTTAAT